MLAKSGSRTLAGIASAVGRGDLRGAGGCAEHLKRPPEFHRFFLLRTARVRAAPTRCTLGAHNWKTSLVFQRAQHSRLAVPRPEGVRLRDINLHEDQIPPAARISLGNTCSTWVLAGPPADTPTPPAIWLRHNEEIPRWADCSCRVLGCYTEGS